MLEFFWLRFKVHKCSEEIWWVNFQMTLVCGWALENCWWTIWGKRVRKMPYWSIVGCSTRNESVIIGLDWIVVNRCGDFSRTAKLLALSSMFAAFGVKYYSVSNWLSSLTRFHVECSYTNGHCFWRVLIHILIFYSKNKRIEISIKRNNVYLAKQKTMSQCFLIHKSRARDKFNKVVERYSWF